MLLGSTSGVRCGQRILRQARPRFNKQCAFFSNFPIGSITMLAFIVHLSQRSFRQRSLSLHALLQLLSNRSLRCIVLASAPMMARVASGCFYQRHILDPSADSLNDFTTHDARTGEVSHAVGGKSSEGIMFMAVEIPATATTPTNLAAIPSLSHPTQPTK
jgi:hypothetical protein